MAMKKNDLSVPIFSHGDEARQKSPVKIVGIGVQGQEFVKKVAHTCQIQDCFGWVDCDSHMRTQLHDSCASNNNPQLSLDMSPRGIEANQQLLQEFDALLFDTRVIVLTAGIDAHKEHYGKTEILGRTAKKNGTLVIALDVQDCAGEVTVAPYFRELDDVRQSAFDGILHIRFDSFLDADDEFSCSDFHDHTNPSKSVEQRIADRIGSLIHGLTRSIDDGMPPAFDIHDLRAVLGGDNTVLDMAFGFAQGPNRQSVAVANAVEDALLKGIDLPRAEAMYVIVNGSAGDLREVLDLLGKLVPKNMHRIASNLNEKISFDHFLVYLIIR